MFGPKVEDFAQWLHRQGYTVSTVRNYLKLLPKLVAWFHRHRVTRLDQVTVELLEVARAEYRLRREYTYSVVGVVTRFLRGHQIIPPRRPEPLTLSRVDAEVDRFAAYLRETRGLAPSTVLGHSQQLRRFLIFLGLEQDASRFSSLQRGTIEAFLRKCARTNNRFSLRPLIATIRSFLQKQHAEGRLSEGLHLQIDTPRVYAQERLPRAIAWDQVQALLRSINRSESCALRDFTMLYMAAAYGLRCGELIRLTLDDIDWRARVLRVTQTKTRKSLQLPLTDEAAHVLIAYLSKGRPSSPHRQLFLRVRAPHNPLFPCALQRTLSYRLRRSGLSLPHLTTHVLRHSFATHLMHQGVAMKTIGDTLGHRSIGSTSVYLRLHVHDLRLVGLPVPCTPPLGTPVKLVKLSSIPPLHPAIAKRHLPAQFHGPFAASLQRFVEFKRGLGRRFSEGIGVLSHWDTFLARHYPQTRKVTPELFNGWARTLNHVNSSVSRRYQQIVRNFLLFHARDHVGTYIPDPLTFPKRAPVVAPYLISGAEMGRILAAVRQLPPSPDNPIRAETFRIGLILLFCCGLRRGELLRLRLGDIQEDQTVLHIQLTKFHKSRLVPLAPSVTAELRKYLRRRCQEGIPTTPDAFLMWDKRRSPEVYGAQGLSDIWMRVCVSAQVLNPRGHPPRLHDIRHSFAVNALGRWYAQGGEVQAKLPHLAAYLGHVNASSTHYYLKLTPELRQAASQRFYQYFAPLFGEEGIA
jgi:site-specific recombinase XerD